MCSLASDGGPIFVVLHLDAAGMLRRRSSTKVRSMASSSQCGGSNLWHPSLDQHDALPQGVLTASRMHGCVQS